MVAGAAHIQADTVDVHRGFPADPLELQEDLLVPVRLVQQEVQAVPDRALHLASMEDTDVGLVGKIMVDQAVMRDVHRQPGTVIIFHGGRAPGHIGLPIQAMTGFMPVLRRPDQRAFIKLPTVAQGKQPRLLIKMLHDDPLLYLTQIAAGDLVCASGILFMHVCDGTYF